jgi:hypothetical protein
MCVDSERKKLQFNIVILIYLYGNPSGSRYQLTEKMFVHYNNVQDAFKDCVNISFTIVGSEGNMSRDLSNKYFPVQSYFEFDQNNKTKNGIKYMKYNNRAYDVISIKANFGMNVAYNKDRGDKPLDIIFWVGSNDYISVSFWKQVVEDYNPIVMKTYGLTSYHEGRNVIYYARTNGESVKNRSTGDSFFTSGKQSHHRQRFRYIGGVLGVARMALDKYSEILDFWTTDEGEVEQYMLHIGKHNSDPTQRIQLFKSSESFFMNIKCDKDSKGKVQDVSTFEFLRKEAKFTCPFAVSQANGMSPMFLKSFDAELQYFNDIHIAPRHE